MPRRRLLLPIPYVGSDDTVYLDYMQDEWGIPVREDRKLFEMLILEVFQAGLSWATILKRRAAFRRAFANWSVKKVAAFTQRDVNRLLKDASIIRNRRKIEAAVTNAKAFLAVRQEHGSFAAYLWGFIGGKPICPARPYKRWQDLPATTPAARALSRDLKERGFAFVGPVSTYAYMQAVGLVDDRVYA